MIIQQEVLDKLTQHNIRPSLQRIAVLDFLMKNRIHPTVDEIYLGLSPSIPTLSKTTVYNVLKNFVESGVVLALNIDDKNVRYDAATEDHTHFMCGICNKVYDLPQPSMANMQLDGYALKKAHIYCWGVCPNCNSKN